MATGTLWNMTHFRAITIVTCVTFMAGFAVAQEDPVSVSIAPERTHLRQETVRAGVARLRTAVNLVLVPVTVTDPLQHPVDGLQRQNFRLYENGIQQNISEFFRQESPISIGIIFDASGSMTPKMERSRQGVAEFLDRSLPGDEFFLLKFADQPEVLSPFTTHLDVIQKGVDEMRPYGWTALFDAIYLGIHEMKHAHHERRVLLIFSDGGDNFSRYTEREMRTLVREADVRIFAVSILDRSTVLENIAEESGGRAYRVRSLDDLPPLAARISSEIHSEYVLGYSPSNGARDGKYRRVKVELAQPQPAPPLHVSWRRGYFGPSE